MFIIHNNMIIDVGDSIYSDNLHHRFANYGFILKSECYESSKQAYDTRRNQLKSKIFELEDELGQLRFNYENGDFND